MAAKRKNRLVTICLQVIYLITVVSCLCIGAVAAAVTESVCMFLLMFAVLTVLLGTAAYIVITIIPGIFHSKTKTEA